MLRIEAHIATSSLEGGGLTASPSGESPRFESSRMDDALHRVLQLIHDRLTSAGALDACLAHHLQSPGKMFRPRLALATAFSLGVPFETAVHIAAACELLHNASLVHDDIMDDDATRRGRETVAKRFGMPAALCTGDYLIARAFAVLAQTPCPHDRRNRLVSAFAEDMAGVIRGQVEECRFGYEDAVDLSAYERMAAGKSGGLFALPVVLAFIAAGFGDKTLATARKAMELWGVLYQIRDDAADIFGVKKGRKAFTDVSEGRMNVVVLQYLTGATTAERAAFFDYLKTGSGFRLETLRNSFVLQNVIAHQNKLLKRAAGHLAALPPQTAECLADGLAKIVLKPADLTQTKD